LGVKFLAEAHDIDAVLTERGADGRGRIGLPSGNLQLDDASNFLCHKIETFNVEREMGNVKDASRFPVLLLAFLHLPVFEFDRGIAAEDVNSDFELSAFGFDFFDHAAEIEEGTVVNLDGLTDIEADLGLFML